MFLDMMKGTAICFGFLEFSNTAVPLLIQLLLVFFVFGINYYNNYK